MHRDAIKKMHRILDTYIVLTPPRQCMNGPFKLSNPVLKLGEGVYLRG